jgi:REP-associated tyrosine transposase
VTVLIWGADPADLLATVGFVARPPRLQVPGGIYHVTSHANAGRILFANAGERRAFLDILAAVVPGRAWSCMAFCLMTTHYHLLIQTPDPDLAVGMQYLNGRLGQRINVLRDEKGHLFEARYGSELVETEQHALNAHRYIALNPVAAGIVARPEDWPWGSYRALLGLAPAPSYLDLAGALLLFGATPQAGRARLREFVQDGAYENVTTFVGV